jgi:hypothetical protein
VVNRHDLVGTGSENGSSGKFRDEDREVIDYALCWVNQGGGPDEGIRSRFGTTAREYYRCVIDILDRDPSENSGGSGLSPLMAARIKATALRRIWS